jgi:hypothetical protein
MTQLTDPLQLSILGLSDATAQVIVDVDSQSTVLSVEMFQASMIGWISRGALPSDPPSLALPLGQQLVAASKDIAIASDDSLLEFLCAQCVCSNGSKLC